MRKQAGKKAGQERKAVASPEAVLKAAEKAPRIFNMEAYFRPIYIMREKGRSWRDLSEWLKQFNIEISHAHLRRLYIEEDERLGRLTEKELRDLGMPGEMIKEFLEKGDPTKRLTAADLADREAAEEEDAMIDQEKEQRRGRHHENG
jgi:DNA-binding transcriptional MerR regulator